MKVTLKYFASMRDQMGRGEDAIEIANNATVIDAWNTVSKDPIPENMLISVNMEYTNAQHMLSDDDEIGFFPPVTGG